MRTIARLPLLLAVLFSTGCNPFLTNYSGERWTPVTSAEVVMQPPSPDAARWIGRADFTSTGQFHDSEAIAAAEQVGADLVEWSDRDLGKSLQWTNEPVYANTWRGNAFGWGPYGGGWGGTMASVPVPVVEEQYRYQARFYRSKSLGGEPVSDTQGHAPPAEVPSPGPDPQKSQPAKPAPP
jgi:hypothetical protein